VAELSKTTLQRKRKLRKQGGLKEGAELLKRGREEGGGEKRCCLKSRRQTDMQYGGKRERRYREKNLGTGVGREIGVVRLGAGA